MYIWQLSVYKPTEGLCSQGLSYTGLSAFCRNWEVQIQRDTYKWRDFSVFTVYGYDKKCSQSYRPEIPYNSLKDTGTGSFIEC